MLKNVMPVKCDQCGVEFTTTHQRMQKSTQHFCSQGCFRKHRTKNNKIQFQCLQCGKECSRRSHKGRVPPLFCSRKCVSLASRKGHEVICAQCGMITYQPACQLKRSTIRFCSSTCSGIFNGKANHLQKVGNFPTRKEVYHILAKVKSMSHQEVQTTIKETPR